MKVHKTISIDLEVYNFHKNAGNNVSAICEEALSKLLDTRPKDLQLEEAGEKLAQEGEAVLAAHTAAKEVRKGRLISQLKQQATEWKADEKAAWQKEASMLQRVLARCAQDITIPRENFNSALANAAARLNTDTKTLANKVFTKGKATIDKVFKERAKPKKPKRG